MFNNVCSSKDFPNNCKAKGSPSLLCFIGNDIAGRPAKFAVTVNISFKYIAIGSSAFSPNLKAGVGVVGVKNKRDIGVGT